MTPPHRPAPDVLALWLAPDPAPTARVAWLRLLVAARAAGRAVTLLDLRPPGAPDDPPLASDEQRWLEALSEDGVTPRLSTPSDLRAALASASTLLCLSARTRPCTPPLLLLNAPTLASLSDSQLHAALRACGHIVLSHPPPP